MFRSHPDIIKAVNADAPIDYDAEKRPGGATFRTQFDVIDRVVIEGQAVLRIIKHVSTYEPTRAIPVQGFLLGLQLGSTVEITNILPHNQTQLFSHERNDAALERERDAKDAKREQEALDHMGKAGLDTCVVGRYSKTAYGSYHRNLKSLEEMYHSGEPPLIIAYDPLRSAMGMLWLKAYVPSRAFIDYLKASRDKGGKSAGPAKDADDAEAEAAGKYEFLKEIPVEIANNTAAQMVLAKVATQPRPVPNAYTQGGELHAWQYRILDETFEKLSETMDNRNGIQRYDNRVLATCLAEETQMNRAQLAMTMDQVSQRAQQLGNIASGIALNLEFVRRMEDDAAKA